MPTKKATTQEVETATAVNSDVNSSDTTPQFSEEFMAILRKRYENEENRGTISKFSTAFANNGKRVYKPGFGLQVKKQGAIAANWLQEINAANGEVSGYTLVTEKRNGVDEESLLFQDFYMHVIQSSDTLIEFTGNENVKEITLPNIGTIKKSAHIGIVKNADGSDNPSGQQFYYDLLDSYPGCFSQRRMYLVQFCQFAGEPLHTIPICLSLKGEALKDFDLALGNLCTELGSFEASLQNLSDASPLTVSGISPYLLHVTTSIKEVSNVSGTMSSDITSFEMGIDGLHNLEKRFLADKVDIFAGYRKANEDFRVRYCKQMQSQFGVHQLLAASDSPQTMQLPGTIADPSSAPDEI